MPILKNDPMKSNNTINIIVEFQPYKDIIAKNPYIPS